MIEYLDKEGKPVLAKKTVYAVFLKAKGWVLPFSSAHGIPGYIVEYPDTICNSKYYDNTIEWFDEEDFKEKFALAHA